MLSRMTIAVAVVILSSFPAVAGRAAVQPSQDPSPNKLESAKEEIERATSTAVERAKGAARTASKDLSDSWITLKTKLSLFADERVSSNDVHVATRHGVIVLTGKVGTEEARQAADEDAAKIEGAKKVENHLVVVPKAARKAVDQKDEKVEQVVEGRIKKDPGLKKAEIEVHVDNGIVTLTGKAPSLRTRVRASEVAYGVSGVHAVHNELAVEEGQG
ncbi:MAG TPA: BON domain-containing protein [Candidatus Methylomirabilis sp.]|nr:BON domain-containing protein [Candidatus Methylomirabilis sp.]